jgi:hypothetical protein
MPASVAYTATKSPQTPARTCITSPRTFSWAGSMLCTRLAMPSRPIHYTRPRADCLLSRLRLRCSASKRQPKDPRQFRDMDDLRAALHAQGSSAPGFLAGGLNLISRDAFGSERCEMRRMVCLVPILSSWQLSAAA